MEVDRLAGKSTGAEQEVDVKNFIVTRYKGSDRSGWEIEHFPVKVATSAEALDQIKTEWGDDPTCRWDVK